MTRRIRACAAAGFLAAMLACASAPAAAAVEDPLPRVETPLCPGVAGFELAFALEMVDRIRANAERLNRRLADPDRCEPNLIVARVEDGRAYFREMMRERRYLFDDVPLSEQRALLANEGPAHVFTRVLTRTRDGQPVPDRENLTDLPQAGMWMAHSKIYTSTRRDIVHTLVLLDNAGIGGMTARQLADYATFRAFLRPRFEAPAGEGGGTILALFDRPADERPPELTASDWLLLSTLYRNPPNMPRSRQLAELTAATGRRPVAD